MTGLTAALIATREITAPNGVTFTVRGLSPEDAFRLYRRHAGELGLWFEKMQAGVAEFSLDAAPALAASLIDTAPGLVAEIIAAATDAGDDEEIIAIARKLSLSVQASALEAIADLTFTQEMPPKKLLETVTRAARSLTSPENVAT